MATLSPVQIASLWKTAYKKKTGQDSPDTTTALMTAIALAESGGRSDAYNSSTATGLWQVEVSAHPQYTKAELENPATNAEAAVEVFTSQGLGAWTTYTSGAYKNYDKTAGNATLRADVDPGTFDAVADDVKDVVEAPVTIADFLGKVTEALFTERGWIRILKFVAGVAIAYIALKALFSGTAVGNAASGIVSTVKDGVTADE
jgi:soluble lytic murein transglycosylase-like protein